MTEEKYRRNKISELRVHWAQITEQMEELKEKFGVYISRSTVKQILLEYYGLETEKSLKHYPEELKTLVVEISASTGGGLSVIKKAEEVVIPERKEKRSGNRKFWRKKRRKPKLSV